MKILRLLVLAVALTHLAPALSKEPMYPPAPAAVQKEFSDFIATFNAALKANDAAAVTGMTKFPFVDDSVDAAQFKTKVYPKVFTPKNRACIQRTKGVYDRDGDGNDNYFITCGELNFVFTKTQAGFLFTDVGDND